MTEHQRVKHGRPEAADGVAGNSDKSGAADENHT